MNYEKQENNKVFLQGEVVTEPVFSHTAFEEDFYSFDLKVARLSGQYDILPVCVSTHLNGYDTIQVGAQIALNGQFRSHNKLDETNKSRLILSVFCKDLCVWDDTANPNVVELSGYVCKDPIFRVTPFNRQICDLLLAVNRQYNKSDYIPCICWGRNAEFVSSMPVGTKMTIMGRIQSREYVKTINVSMETIKKVAYEVSVNRVVIDNQNDI
mgnify:CR=1 FL=1